MILRLQEIHPPVDFGAAPLILRHMQERQAGRQWHRDARVPPAGSYTRLDGMFNGGIQILRHGANGWRWFLLLYLLLLLISNAIMMVSPDPGPAYTDQQSINMPAPYHTDDMVTDIQLRYLDTQGGKPVTEAQPVILLINASPRASGDVMHGLVEALKPAGRVIAPDLPGFGSSTRDIPDYGFKSQADYLSRLIEQLDIPRAHLVAHSMGGGAALHLSQLMPERVASLTMLSAVGVQEYELLGDYYLNRTLYGVQLVLLWGLRHLVPHLGMIDYFPLSVEYARNFYDADQRPLRSILAKWKAPMLILHGRHDRTVPYAAALEHHRLVPQSELIAYGRGHSIYRMDTARVAREIRQFIKRIESGRGKTRSMASTVRIIAAAKPMQMIETEPAGVAGTMLIILLIAFSTLISEDLACIGAGLLAARGVIGLWPAVGGAFAGIVGGDLILFSLGRIAGRPALKRRPLKWFLTAEDIENSSRWFASNGLGIILASRFVPGSRLPTFFSAGMLGRRMGPFIFYFCLAAALWTPVVVGVGALVGEQLMEYYYVFHGYAVWALLGLVLLIWATVKFVLPLFTYRGRRLWTARFRRLTRWEFWPTYIFYTPIVFYILYLGLRFRCLTLFTSANPGIPAGGIVGESKSDILQRLRPALGNVARFIRVQHAVPRQEQIQQVRLFMQRLRIDFPLVFKPDAGQRGNGVSTVASLEQAEAYLSQTKTDTIVQEYVEGREFGVFYYRYPGSRSGRIFSITDKRLPALKGDGQSTLEKLILDDERALCMAPVHFRKHKSKLQTVPAKGESIALVQVGTHCRGALFLDGNHLITPALERAIDGISRRFKGFYFGRYDIRCPSVEAFQAGMDFSVVELNGVTSEATHIYQPGNGLLQAYATMMRQWRICFEIGAANARNGIRPISVRALINPIVLKVFRTAKSRRQG
ncbi:MAG: alpha/beta fold hydrolase [Desulfobacteraceae bacterium]